MDTKEFLKEKVTVIKEKFKNEEYDDLTFATTELNNQVVTLITYFQAKESLDADFFSKIGHSMLLDETEQKVIISLKKLENGLEFKLFLWTLTN